MTVQFVTQQKEEAALELRKREQALAEFLAKHSEFAQDQVAEGAGIRAIRNTQKTPINTGNPRLYALERQRQRIQARLDAPPDAPVVRVPSPPSPEKLQAEAAVTDAQREVSGAQRELEDALSKYTDKHPTVIKAQEHLEQAQQKLRHAQAAVPPDDNTPLPPATPADRSKLQKELAQIEDQISGEQHSSSPKPAGTGSGSGAGSGSVATPIDSGTNWVVELETQYADLRRALNEQRERVSSLADSVFRAQIDASQKSAEQGGRLSVVDPAFKPVRPSGPGKTVFLLAGLVLFLGLGATIAIGLAILDDRLYRRDDIDQLDIAVLAVIPPIENQPKRAS
jgi:exonuclease VII small subunit